MCQGSGVPEKPDIMGGFETLAPWGGGGGEGILRHKAPHVFKIMSVGKKLLIPD